VSFIEARVEELPVWLRGTNGIGVATAQGAQQDLELRLEIAGTKQRWPTTCDDEALDDVGVRVQIERYPGESNDVYRARLLEAFPTWNEAGTPQAIIDQLHACGIEDVTVVRDYDGVFAPGRWFSRFWVILGPKMPWSPLRCGAFTCGDGSTCGSTATLDQIRLVKRVILKWKGDRGYPVKVILWFPDLGRAHAPTDHRTFGVPLGKLGDHETPLRCGEFTCGGSVPGFRPYVSWRIGKTTRDTLLAPPFTTGMFFDGSGSRYDGRV
jgi:hypothetical protein